MLWIQYYFFLSIFLFFHIYIIRTYFEDEKSKNSVSTHLIGLIFNFYGHEVRISFQESKNHDSEMRLALKALLGCGISLIAKIVVVLKAKDSGG